MMAPSLRLLWVVAGAGFPVAVAAGLIPSLRPAAWGAAIAVLCLAAADAWLSPGLLRGVRIQTASPMRVYWKREARLLLECGSDGGARRVRLGIPWPETFVSPFEEQTLELTPGGLRIDWPFTPRRRGEYTLEAVYVECASRLGFWAVRRGVALGAVIHVLPALHGRVDLLAFRRETAGLQAQRQIGKGREFEKLREYLPGDGFDEIHWKAAARRARPITKVFQVERTREIYVALDGTRLPGRAAGDGTRLDRYISASLVLSAAAERGGDLFGLITFHDGLTDFVPAGRGAAHGAACRQALSRLNERPLSPDFLEVAAQVSVRMRGRAMILFLTDLDDAATAEGFSEAAGFLSRRHVVAAATMRPAAARPLFSGEARTIEDVYEQVGGHLGWRALKELEARLRHQGVRLGVFEEGALSRQVSGLYHEIKMRQLI
jgi:uncharacterized protein (DUF58 family)